MVFEAIKILGEAKRRKKLDPNFGKKKYKIEFLEKNQVDEVLQQKWSEIEIAEKRPAFTCFKFIYNQETCFGLAFINMIKDTLALDYEWILDPEKITKQEKIIERHIEIISQELLKEVMRKEGYDFNTKQISEIFSQTDAPNL